MNKHYLLRRISVIHLIKCNRGQLFNEALASFDSLNQFKELVIHGAEDQLENISGQINTWAGTAPIATENEIRQLM